MNNNLNSYFLFGGSFFTKLQPILQANGTIAGQWNGISPISEISLSGQSNAPALTYWLPELEADLTAAPADYFVLDLQLALTHLLASEAGFVSASADNQAQLTRPEAAFVDPILLPQETVFAALDRLAAAIGKHFTAKRIILIHTHNGPFWLAGNNLRAEAGPGPDAAHAAWLDNLEQHFCETTGCHFVDVTRFYFYKKEAGLPLTNVVFEDECYLDVADRIFDIAAGGDGKAERPNFAYSLDRYVEYYFTLQRKPQRVFLNMNYFLDRLVLCASDNFIKQYREELIDLDVVDWHEPKKVLDVLTRRNPDDDLIKICAAFYAVQNGLYHEADVDYALMFRSDVVPDLLIAYLKDQYAAGANLVPNQITRYNAGLHFARMLGLDPAPFCTELTVEKPTTVDVFGSCVSRTPFNVQDNDFVINRYWFHVAPFEYRNKPVKYPAKLFPGRLSWIDRLVKQQFDCTLYQDIRESDSEWLVIDLYFLIGPNNFYYQDCLFGNFDHRIATLLKAKRVDLFRDPSMFGTTEDLFRAMDPWLELIKKKYGKKIIMIGVERIQHWIGDDDRIYKLPNPYTCNEYLQRAQEYVRSKTDCYQIDVGKNFLPDDLGYMRNTPAHKEDLGYFAVHNLARYIVDNMPEQKVFTQYSGQTHMAHLERLVQNNSAEAMAEALPLSELDKAVVNLGYVQMCQWHDELVELYDKADWSLSLDAILSAHVSNRRLYVALRNAAKSASHAAAAIQLDYSDYPDNGQIITGSFANCVLPKVPSLAVKQTACNTDTAAISWACPANTCVRVYRKTKDTPWTLIGKSTEGIYRDQTIAPLTEYQYCLCVEVNQDSKTYLANFTAPVTISTAPATAQLVSAVNFAGVNTLRWAPVAGAEKYRIYHKPSLSHKWQVCATVSATEDTCYQEPSQFPAGGEWYTVRAVSSVNGKDVAGGFQSGLCATAP